MPTIAPKPRVFIGSSSEARDLALAVQHELKDAAICELWSQGMFRVGSVPLDVLTSALNGFDFAIFIFAPDDVTVMRDQKSPAVRDNVLFELGLFMGRLGHNRSFFIAPVKAEDIRLPSDLSGIIPARYDPKLSDLQAAVTDACFEIRKVVRDLGPVHKRVSCLFDGGTANLSANFIGVEAKEYRDNRPATERARGSMVVDGNTITVERTNSAGKFELQLRPTGPNRPSFEKSYSVPRRLIRINCEAKVEGGDHTLRFVLKDEGEDKWLGKSEKIIRAGDWTPLETYLWVSSTKDLLFRIDDIEPTQVPSTVFLRNLIIVEEGT
jgi:hypothetical protein